MYNNIDKIKLKCKKCELLDIKKIVDWKMIESYWTGLENQVI